MVQAKISFSAGHASVHAACRDCEGRGHVPVEHLGAFVRERVKDMVSELHGIASDHAARANARLHGRHATNSEP